jgi:hypothetical protein
MAYGVRSPAIFRLWLQTKTNRRIANQNKPLFLPAYYSSCFCEAIRRKNFSLFIRFKIHGTMQVTFFIGIFSIVNAKFPQICLCFRLVFFDVNSIRDLFTHSKQCLYNKSFIRALFPAVKLENNCPPRLFFRKWDTLAVPCPVEGYENLHFVQKPANKD